MPKTTHTTLRLRVDAVHAAMAARGIPDIAALAVELKVPKVTVWRAMTGQSQPGPALIAAFRLRLNLPWDFILDAQEVQAA